MRKFYKQFKLLLLFTFITGIAAAQQFTVTGKVTDGSTGEALIGVNVVVKGTTFGAITDIEGNYNLKVEGPSAQLVFTFIGYLSEEAEVSSIANTLNMILMEDVTKLQEVVVTGLASSIKRSNLANSVASISSKELSGTTTQSTMDGALYGKFKGANITSNSGAPGGGISIKLRGITSINASNEPLYIIDGIYLDNSTISAGLNVVSAASGGGSQSTQDNPSNRIADIDPEDIETIEVLKGASAAAMYGSRASGGVIIITTKKGKAGKTKISLSQSIGFVKILNPLGVRDFTEQRVRDTYNEDEVALFTAAKNAGTLRNYEDELYGHKGLLSTTRLTLSGGTDKTNFFFGITRKNDEAIVKNTGYEKTSFRLNLGHQVTDWLEMNVSSSFINSSADRGFFNNDNSGTTMGISFVSTRPWTQLLPDADGNYPNNPNSASNFLQTRDLITNNESINRLIGGVSATATIFKDDKQNLKFIGRAGVDYYNLATSALFPNSLQFQKNGNGTNGVSVQGTTVNRNTNYSAFLVHTIFPRSSDLSLTTQLGITAENFDNNGILGTATNLNGAQTNLDQSGSRDIAQSRLIQNDRGFFVQEEVNYNDKIIATLGLRGDKSTNNGDVNKLFYYPKASLAINLHEFDFWSMDNIDLLKLRIAYGQAGNFATFGSKYTPLGGIIINGIPGIRISSVQGNSNVEPERQEELEFGFDLGLLQNKIGIDFTYYIKTVTDQLLTRQVPSSSGFTSQVVNAADMKNKGIEIGLNLNLVNTDDIKWSSRTSFWTNKAEVTRLDIPSYTTGGFADFLGQFRIKEGHSPTEIIGVGENPDEDGLVVFGNAEADFQMSFQNSVSYKNFEFSMLWHWKQGGENINLTTLLSDLNGTSFDFDKIDLDPEGKLGNGDYRLGELGSNSAPYIENAGYVRMREIGIYYNIPKSIFSDVMSLKVGFSGNNLINFFEYRSYDPEVSNFGGKGLSSGVEVTPFPSAKRFNFHVIANF